MKKKDKQDMVFVGSITCEILTARDLVNFLETILRGFFYEFFNDIYFNDGV